MPTPYDDVVLSCLVESD